VDINFKIKDYCRFYDGADDWFYNTGTPTKYGDGCGTLTVVPGKLAIGVFARPLDKIGNSVKGHLAAAYL
jgi:glutaminase